MKLGELLARSWSLIWKHPFLLVLGLLISAGLGSSAISLNLIETRLINEARPIIEEALSSIQAPIAAPPVNGNSEEAGESSPTAANESNPLTIVFALVALLGFFLLIASLYILIFGLIALTARGGIIHSVHQIQTGISIQFLGALRAGWKRLWFLMIIISVPILPVIFALILIVIQYTLWFGGEGATSLADLGGPFQDPAFVTTAQWTFLPLLGVGLILGFFQVLADRACVVEGLNANQSFLRAFQVFGQHWQAALLLLGTELLLRLALGLLISLLTLTIVLRFLIPVPLFLGMMARALFTTMWTLAWLDWTQPGQSRA
ncbi:MAG: hypothetical protein GYB68_19360, partial [Chloroflexi bacterium]|nr:hypothetical protein [Chloroflexota bacterium]